MQQRLVETDELELRGAYVRARAGRSTRGMRNDEDVVPQPCVSRVLLGYKKPNARRALAEALQMDGHEVLSAGDGGSFLSQLGQCVRERRYPDLILLDTQLPRLNMGDLLSELGERADELPLVLLGWEEELRGPPDAAWKSAAIFSPPYDLVDLRTIVMLLISIRARAWRGA